MTNAEVKEVEELVDQLFTHRELAPIFKRLRELAKREGYDRPGNFILNFNSRSPSTPVDNNGSEEPTLREECTKLYEQGKLYKFEGSTKPSQMERMLGEGETSLRDLKTSQLTKPQFGVLSFARDISRDLWRDDLDPDTRAQRLAYYLSK